MTTEECRSAGRTLKMERCAPFGRGTWSAKEETEQDGTEEPGKEYKYGKGLYCLSYLCVCLATGACVHYIKLTAELTAQKSAQAQLELELNELKADNDAYYSDVMSSVDLDEIRDRAINELGMEYATEDQIKYYVPGNNSYVRQYQDIPEE